MKKISKLDSIKTILIAGVNTRAIAKPAKELGSKVIAVDKFNDIDLNNCVDILYTPEKKNGDLNKSETDDLFNLTHKAIEIHDVDGVILSSGMEHDPEAVKAIDDKAEVIGNKPKQLELCENQKKLFNLTEKLEIPHPRTSKAKSVDEALKIGTEIGYPVLLKPFSTGGGIGHRLVKSSNELEKSYEEVLNSGDGKSLYIQQFIEGVDASASIISNGSESRCISVNKQIIGDKKLNVPRKFGYCGNITPLSAEKTTISKISKYSEKICSEIGLLGSNGVDFVVSDKPYLIEVNPRFQNTIDMLEGILGINLVKTHIQSYFGKLIERKKLEKCSVKLIIYAKKRFEVPDLSSFSNVVDIPKKGSIIDEGEPICSILKFGNNRKNLIRKTYEIARKVQRACYKSER